MSILFSLIYILAMLAPMLIITAFTALCFFVFYMGRSRLHIYTKCMFLISSIFFCLGGIIFIGMLLSNAYATDRFYFRVRQNVDKYEMPGKVENIEVIETFENTENIEGAE